MNIVFASFSLAAAAAAHSPFRPLPPEAGREDHVVDKAGGKAAADDSGTGRAGLPYAFGRRFKSLDEYLLHLQQHAAPIDLPWWRKVGPDRFERVIAIRTPTPPKHEVASRAELMRRYGFER